jgi:hypothetical protein
MVAMQLPTRGAGVISDVRTFFLWGWSDSLDPPVRVFQTVVFSKATTVTLTAMLSMVSLGAENFIAGTAGAVISKVGLLNARGGTDTVDMSNSFENNGGRFVGCVFVTFCLSLSKARGVGKFTVYFHG